MQAPPTKVKRRKRLWLLTCSPKQARKFCRKWGGWLTSADELFASSLLPHEPLFIDSFSENYEKRWRRKKKKSRLTHFSWRRKRRYYYTGDTHENSGKYIITWHVDIGDLIFHVNVKFLHYLLEYTQRGFTFHLIFNSFSIAPCPTPPTHGKERFADSNLIFMGDKGWEMKAGGTPYCNPWVRCICCLTPYQNISIKVLSLQTSSLLGVLF